MIMALSIRSLELSSDSLLLPPAPPRDSLLLAISMQISALVKLPLSPLAKFSVVLPTRKSMLPLLPLSKRAIPLSLQKQQLLELLLPLCPVLSLTVLSPTSPMVSILLMALSLSIPIPSPVIKTMSSWSMVLSPLMALSRSLLARLSSSLSMGISRSILLLVLLLLPAPLPISMAGMSLVARLSCQQRAIARISDSISLVLSWSMLLAPEEHYRI